MKAVRTAHVTTEQIEETCNRLEAEGYVYAGHFRDTVTHEVTRDGRRIELHRYTLLFRLP